jgi:1-phosphatidylinositol-4-phosphate 5-kinase
MEDKPIAQLDTFDTFTYLIIGPFSILSSAVLLVAHLFTKELRKAPGDLIIMISFSELILSIHWFASAIRTEQITESYENYGTFCTLNSIIAVGGAAMEISYNLCFLAYLFFAIRSSIRKSWTPRWSYHIFCLSMTVFAYFNSHRKMFTRNPYGTCSVKMGPKDAGLGAGIIVTSVFFAIFVYFYSSRNLPGHGEGMGKFRREFLSYYGTYIKSLIVIWILIFLSMVCQGLSLNHMEDRKVLFLIGKFGNTAKIMMPLILFFIRTEDPAIKKYLFSPFLKAKKLLINRAQKLIGNEKEEDETEKVSDNISLVNEKTENSSVVINFSEEKELEQEFLMEDGDTSWMSLLPAKIKETFTRTVLGAVGVYYPELIQSLIIRPNLTPADASEAGMYRIEGKELMTVCSTVRTLLDCKMTVYAPMIFASIMQNLPIDLRSSFDVNNNEERIKKAGENKGGASGELFLFSHDNRLIIKTITQDEYQIFRKILPQYGEHFRSNSTSFIGKIYGLFDFDFTDTSKTIKLVIMENLFTVDPDYVMRKYDMKGSTHSRRVLKSYEEVVATSYKNGAVLKDLDFLEIDKTISVANPMGNERMILLQKIRKDVEFFRGLSIIDYSVVVAVLDGAIVDETVLRAEYKNRQHLIVFSNDRQLIYILGIIDYFQLYDFKKASERAFKRLRACDSGLETSSQPPARYANRFFMFLESVIV